MKTEIEKVLRKHFIPNVCSEGYFNDCVYKNWQNSNMITAANKAMEEYATQSTQPTELAHKEPPFGYVMDDLFSKSAEDHEQYKEKHGLSGEIIPVWKHQQSTQPTEKAVSDEVNIVLDNKKELMPITPTEKSEAVEGWRDISISRPFAYMTGNWDGKKSDKVLVRTKDRTIHVAVMYEGFMDGNEFVDFYDNYDSEIKDVAYWKEI